jgi:hypothetical protein
MQSFTARLKPIRVVAFALRSHLSLNNLPLKGGDTILHRFTLLKPLFQQLSDHLQQQGLGLSDPRLGPHPTRCKRRFPNGILSSPLWPKSWCLMKHSTCVGLILTEFGTGSVSPQFH